MIVVDSNVIAARNLTVDCTWLAHQVEERDPIWVAPPLWRYEFQNILAKSIWARQIASDDGVRAWRNASGQMLENEHEASPERVIEISARHRITAYDANFVALAVEMGVRCVTEDGELLDKFPNVAVSMRRFVDGGTTGVVLRESRAEYRTSRKR